MTDDEIRHAANQILDRPFGDYDDDAAICARFALAALRPPVERADIPSYWSDRTAALAEALRETGWPLNGERMAEAFYRVTEGRFAVNPLMPTLPPWRDPSVGDDVWEKAIADGEEIVSEYKRLAAPESKDALLYLREHGWTLEREER